MIKRIGLTALLVSALTFFMSHTTWAKSNGGYAGAFLRMGLGAEALAQGDAFTARADNGFAGYYNPAGLAFLKQRTAATSYSHLALDRSFNFLGISLPLKPSAGVSIGWINAGVTNIDGRDFDGNHYGNLEYFENAFTFGFANRFSKYVAVGIGVKVLYDLFPETLEDDKALKSTSVGFDVGVIVQPIRELRIGLQARDINAKNSWDTSEYWSEGLTKNDDFPTIFKIGAAYFPIEGLEAEYDLELSSQEVIEHHFGFEYAVFFKGRQQFALRTGYDNDVPTFGFGYLFPIGGLNSQLDAAYIIEDVAPDDTMIFSWSLMF